MELIVNNRALVGVGADLPDTVTDVEGWPASCATRPAASIPAVRGGIPRSA
jgi:hypothetical protein